MNDSERASRNKLLSKRKSTLRNYKYRIRRLLRQLMDSKRLSPDFIIAGSQRSGTTSLFSFLSQDKHFFRPIKKEIHYFDNFYFKGIKWYKSHFPSKRYKGQKLIGEASPYYMFHPLAMSRIATDLDGVKIILVLRNPIERAYSHYKWEVSQGFETLTFEDALKEEEIRLKGEKEKIIENPNYYSFNYQHFSYTSRGNYAEQVRNIYQLFGADKCLVLASERLFSKDEQSIERLSEFLGVPRLDFGNFRVSNSTKKSSMAEETRQYLKEHYEKSNNELFSLINEKFNWE